MVQQQPYVTLNNLYGLKNNFVDKWLFFLIPNPKKFITKKIYHVRHLRSYKCDTKKIWFLKPIAQQQPYVTLDNLYGLKNDFVDKWLFF
ncbi:hypothetical protein [Flavobacterium restrictum]|uniref:Uncharacterized protein n=1 Tax=Flavobacterium restrictum TaxID=2594428 RepID=A0A553EBB5_9FLAO|nr:hypothetical protein [Flavobacterium restrictum]TRX42336.1 hypothetical protein FNW21_03500 [Flavobacterium restrictum]